MKGRVFIAEGYEVKWKLIEPGLQGRRIPIINLPSEASFLIETQCYQLRLHFGVKKTGKISVVFEDLSKIQSFFEPK